MTRRPAAGDARAAPPEGGPRLEVLTATTSPPLERALLARIARLQRNDPFAPVLVVAPTGRLLVRVRRLLLAEGVTRWALHLLHHRSLAERIVETAGLVPLRVLRTREQIALLAEVLDGQAARGREENRGTVLPVRGGQGGPSGLRGTAGPLVSWARGRAGARAALHGTLRDLRDAGLPPDEALRFRSGDERWEEIARIYAAWCRALAALEERGAGDAASLAAQAVGCAGRSTLIGRAAGLIHHGAYDLTGVNRRLVDAISNRIETLVLVPGHGPGPAFAHSRRTVENWLGDRIASAVREMAVEGAGVFAPALRFLYDEGAVPPPVPGAPFEVLSAPGAEAELETAARRALALHATGIPLEEIAIVARTLEPYAPHIESVVGREHGLPFVTSARRPLRAEPVARAARDLLAALAGDFPSRELTDYLLSPRARLDGLTRPGGTSRPLRWIRVARRAGVMGGGRSWKEDPIAWAEEREREAAYGRNGLEDDDPAAGESLRRARDAAREDRESAEGLARVVETLESEAERWSRCETWKEHAGFIRQLLRSRIRPSSGDLPAAPWNGLLGLVEELGRREELRDAADGVTAGEGSERSGRNGTGGRSAGSSGNGRGRENRRPVTREGACRALVEAIDAESLPISATQGPGLAILDVMQLRGLSFRYLLWLGLNSGLVPRRPRADPILSDEVRERLREATGAAVPVKSDSRDEERLLAAMTLGAARERVFLSWQRVDREGRGQAVSLLMRELARVLTGSADTRSLTDSGSVRLVPFHPGLRAKQEAGEGTGLVGFLDACVAIAGSRRSEEDAANAIATLSSHPPVSPEREQLAQSVVTGSFSPWDLSFDGDTCGAIQPERPWSPARFEKLGQCPLQYFFRHALHVGEAIRPAEETALDPRELGGCVHRVLERLYATLMTERLLPVPKGESAERVRGRAGELTPELFREESAGVARRMRRRLPALWESLESRWLESIVRLVLWDIDRLAAEGTDVLGTEIELESGVSAGEGVTIPMHGRMDRLDAPAAGGLRIVDYKSSPREPREYVDLANVLKGRRLQMPLYRLMTAESEWAGVRAAGPEAISGRILTVHPERDPYASDSGAMAELSIEARKGGEQVALSLLHTLRTLDGLAASGLFPFRSGEHCRFCDYEDACRKSHPPSVERVEAAPRYRGYYLLQDKSTKNLFPQRKTGEERKEDSG